MSDADGEATFRALMESEEVSFRDIMACVFGIHDRESRTYLALLGSPASTVAELADDLERDRSNVNRSLTRLLEKGLVARERRLLDSGGYVYQYSAVDLSTAKERMHDALDEWAEQVHERIEEFGERAARTE